MTTVPQCYRRTDRDNVHSALRGKNAQKVKSGWAKYTGGPQGQKIGSHLFHSKIICRQSQKLSKIGSKFYVLRPKFWGEISEPIFQIIFTS